MHRVVVIPLAAPDKAVSLEYRDNPMRNPILVRNQFSMIARGVPTPIVRVIRIDIDSDAKGMCTQLFGSGDRSPVEGAAGLENILLLLGRELIEFGRYRLKLPVDSIHSGDANSGGIRLQECLRFSRGAASLGRPNPRF